MLLTTALLGLAALAPADTIPKRFSLFPLPVVYYTPETRFAYGAAATATIRFRRDAGFAAARPSQVTFGAAYTQNKQFAVYLPFQVFYDHNNYYANGELGYYRYNYYFYGLGTTEVPRELFGVTFPRVRLNLYRRIVPRLKQGTLYAGLRYQYEDYDVTSVVAGGLLDSGTVPGGQRSRLTGGGLGLFFDSRDNLFYPTKGMVADVRTMLRNQAVGAGLAGQTTYSDRYVADVSSYHALHEKLVLAVNYYASFTAGKAPFNAISLLGGTRRMRGYYEGRYRDQNAGLLQTELRVGEYKRFGAVVFGAVGVLGDGETLLRLNAPKAAYGAGLRFVVNRRDHLNLRIDYGMGRQSSGFYLTIGEAF